MILEVLNTANTVLGDSRALGLRDLLAQDEADTLFADETADPTVHDRAELFYERASVAALKKVRADLNTAIAASSGIAAKLALPERFFDIPQLPVHLTQHVRERPQPIGVGKRPGVEGADGVEIELDDAAQCRGQARALELQDSHAIHELARGYPYLDAHASPYQPLAIPMRTTCDRTATCGGVVTVSSASSVSRRVETRLRVRRQHDSRQRASRASRPAAASSVSLFLQKQKRTRRWSGGSA